MKRRILAVFAHPDDETFCCGGTLAKYASEGSAVYLICATKGQVGRLGNSKAKDPKLLAKIREKELAKASKILGIKKVHLLNYPDGNLKKWQENLEEDLLKLTEKIKPDILITFEKIGVTKHSDHITISESASKVGHLLAERIGFPRKIYWVVFPESFFKDLNYKGMDGNRVEGHPEEEISSAVNIERFLELKVKALKEFKSQVKDVKVYLEKNKVSPQKEECFILVKGSKLEERENDLFYGL